jgi:hypothetical protein
MRRGLGGEQAVPARRPRAVARATTSVNPASRRAADALGIRKSSVYSHIRGEQDLLAQTLSRELMLLILSGLALEGPQTGAARRSGLLPLAGDGTDQSMPRPSS